MAIFDFNKKEDTEVDVDVPVAKLPASPLMFSNDVLCLMFSIKHQLRLSLIILANSELNKEFIAERVFKDLATNVAYGVLTDMSEVYKALLLNYWSEEGLHNFVVNIVTMELSNITIKLNNTRMDGKTDSVNSVLLARTNEILTEYN